MLRPLQIIGLLALGGVAVVTVWAQSSRPQAPADVVATIGSVAVTLAEVDERALKQSTSSYSGMLLSQALYEARRGALEVVIGERLIDQEAKAQGVAREELIDREITSKVAPPTDADVEAWYKVNQNRTQGASLDQIRAPIRDLLTLDRTEHARQRYLDSLRSRIPVTTSLEPPRLAVSDEGRPTRGPSTAAVQIIEFSDFECPFCLRAFPTVMQVLKTYGDQVRLTYRHYPLPNHPNARPAAEASACAADQNKFWEYHDRLFAAPGKLDGADLIAHAAALGLNVATFSECVSARTHRKVVEDDTRAGDGVGVSGTPAFFINGRLLSGAQPFDAFKRVIDEEIARRR